MADTEIEQNRATYGNSYDVLDFEIDSDRMKTTSAETRWKYSKRVGTE